MSAKTDELMDRMSHEVGPDLKKEAYESMRDDMSQHAFECYDEIAVTIDEYGPAALLSLQKASEMLRANGMIFADRVLDLGRVTAMQLHAVDALHGLCSEIAAYEDDSEEEIEDDDELQQEAQETR